MKEYLKIANEPMMWLMCIPPVIIGGIQAIAFSKKAFDTVKAKAVNISKETCWKAFKVGAISAIGPAIAVFIVMLGMMAVVGAPITWFRLSVIGAAPTELTTATLGAKALGVEFGSPEYDLTAYSASVWAMTLNGLGWMIFAALFTHKLEAFEQKFTKGDAELMGKVGGAALLGSLSYLVSDHVTKGIPNFIAAFSAAISMLILLKLSEKYKWLKEYNLGIAMLVGMFITVFIF